MDENQIGPNINTTTVRKSLGDVPLQLKGHGFNPQCGQFGGREAGLETHQQKKFIFFPFFCALILSPLLGTPENAGVM